jgi:hypothetical protein
MAQDCEGGSGAETFGAVEDDDLRFAGVDEESHIVADTGHAINEELEVCRGVGKESAVVGIRQSAG